MGNQTLWSKLEFATSRRLIPILSSAHHNAFQFINAQVNYGWDCLIRKKFMCLLKAKHRYVLRHIQAHLQPSARPLYA